MSLQDLKTVIDGPEWGSYSLDDKLDILSGGFSAEIAAAKDEKVKEALFKDFRESQSVTAANEVRARLGTDEKASLKTKAFEEFLATEDPRVRREGASASQGNEDTTLYDPASVIRQVEAVEALTDKKLGGKELREEFVKFGADAIPQDRLVTALANPQFSEARDAVRTENADLKAFFDFAGRGDETEFRPFLADAKNPDGTVQIRKKPEPGSTYQVKFPNGTVEDFKFQKEEFGLRDANLVERAVAGAAEGAMESVEFAASGTGAIRRIFDGDLPFVSAFQKFQNTSLIPEKTGERQFNPSENPVPSNGQLLDFIGQRSGMLSDEQRRKFEGERGRYDISDFRNVAVSAPLRGAVGQTLTGIAGTVDMVRREAGGSEDSMAAQFSQGGRQANSLLNQYLAPRKADTGLIGSSLATISEAGSGLLADILVAKGAGRIAGVAGATEAGVAQAAKAGFTASASTKIVGSTYDDSFADLRQRGLSLQDAHSRAEKEAVTVGLVTAALERFGPAEFFLSPKQAKGVADVVRSSLKGGIAEGLGEEAPQALAQVVIQDLVREDGSRNEEINNLREALGRGNLDAFKNSQILQGIVGGFGAGAAVGAVQAAGEARSSVPENTAELSDAEIQQAADINLARQASEAVDVVLPDGDVTAGQARRAAIEAAPASDADLSPEALAAATPQVGDTPPSPTAETNDNLENPQVDVPVPGVPGNEPSPTGARVREAPSSVESVTDDGLSTNDRIALDGANEPTAEVRAGSDVFADDSLPGGAETEATGAGTDVETGPVPSGGEINTGDPETESLETEVADEEQRSTVPTEVAISEDQTPQQGGVMQEPSGVRDSNGAPAETPVAPSETAGETPNRAPAPNRTDRQLLDEAKPALTAANVGKNLRVTGKPLTKGQKTARQIGETFGRRVVFLSGSKANGANIRSMPGTIFISDSANRAETLVAYHELTHSLAATDPKAYQKLRDAVQADLAAYAQRYRTRANANQEVTNEEFLADFVADRASDPAFWQDMATKDRSLFDKITTLLRSIIRKVKSGRLGTEQFVKNLDAADAAVREALETLRSQGNVNSPQVETSGDVRTELPEGREDVEGDKIQTVGTENPFIPRRPANYDTARRSVARSFNWETAALNSEGQKRATRFLAKLSNPRYIAQLKKSAEARGVRPEDSFIVSGMARGAVVAYASRLAATDYKAAETLIHKLYKTASDIGFLFPDGIVNASSIGKALNSLRSYEGGSIVGMFAREGETRAAFVKDRVGEEALAESRKISNAEVTGQAAEDLADAIGFDLDEASRDRITRAETAARNAWKQVASLIARIRKPQEVFTELPEGGDIDSVQRRFDELVNSPDASLEDMAAAFDQLLPLLQKDLDAAAKKAVTRARRSTKKATDASEEATGTTNTKNQVDILGKRRIGIVTRARNAVDEEQAALREKFNDLMVAGLEKDAFVEAYEELGGTPEVGAELFEANAVLIERQQNKAAETERRQRENAAIRRAENAEARRKAAIEKAQEFVDKVGDKTVPRRPTAEGETPTKAVSRFINPKNAEITIGQFEAQLREFQNADGQRTFTDDQIQEISSRAQLARQDAVENLAAAAREKAERAVSKAVVAAREKRRLAVRAAQEFTEGVGEQTISRPTAPKDTPRKAILRYTNPNNVDPAETLETQLREFANADGEPTFNDSQIREIMKRATAAREDARAAKSEQARIRFTEALDRRDFQESRRRVNSAESLFAIRAPQQKDPNKRSIRDIILEDFINNPERRILNQQERIEFAEEILREKTDLTDAEIPAVARKIEGRLAAKLNEEKFKAARSLLRTLGGEGKNLTRSQIEKAIRLEVLDPSNDFITSIAALNGWDGLTARETARLTELQREIDLLGPLSRAGVSRIMEQARIIEAAPGIPPKWKDSMNAYIRGSIYSSIGSQLVSVTVGIWETGMNALTESLVSIVNNRSDPARMLEELTEFHGTWARNITRGVREAGRVFKTGTTYADQVQGGQEASGKTEGKVFVDELTRIYDDSARKLPKAIADLRKNPSSKTAARVVWQLFRKYVIGTERFLFRTLSAVDSSFTKANEGTISNILAYRRARDLGMTRAEIKKAMDAAVSLAESHRAYLVTEVGLTNPNEIAVEVQDAIDGAFYQGLTEAGVEGLDTLLGEVTSDFQDRIGTGETSQETFIGKSTRSVTGLVQSFPVPLAGIIPAVRTVGNVMDYLAWTAPGVGLYRAIRFNSKTAEERNAYFPNIKADWQFRRRQALAVLTNAATLAIMGLLKANEDEPDDEKWFWYTGSYPAFDKKQQDRWKRNNWTENTLMVGPLRFQLDRGFGQTLYVPMLTGTIMYEAMDGVDGKEAVKNIVGLAEAFIPGFSQGKGQFKSADSVYGAEKWVDNQTTTLVPFSALLKTFKRIQPRVDQKNTEATLFQSNPFYTDTDADGVSTVRNVLGEPLAQDENPWGWIQKIGAPVYFKVEAKDRDPVKKKISDDFYAKQYSGGEVTLKAFKTKLEKTDTPFSPAIYKEWKVKRIAAFTESYMRQRDTLLKADNYNAKVGSLWGKAGQTADRELGIRKNAN